MLRKKHFVTGGDDKKFVINKIKTIDSANKNVICISFFTFQGAYKPLGYYANGISLLENAIRNNRTKHNILLRIYYDATIDNTTDQQARDVMSQLRESPVTELYFVDSSKLIELEKQMLLTVIFRYMPLFDFSDNDCKNAYVLDCDLTPTKSELDKITYMVNEFATMIDKGCDLKVKVPLCYTPFWSQKINLNIDVVLGQNIGGKAGIFPAEMFVKFLNSFINKKDKVINRFLNIYVEYVKKNEEIKKDDEKFLKKKNSAIDGEYIYVYGFDEFFLNFYLLPWACKNLGKICMHTTSTQGGLPHLFINTFIENQPKQKTTDFLHAFAEKYGLSQIKNINFAQFISLYDKHDWTGKNEENNKIYEKFNEYCRINEKELISKKLINKMVFKCFKAHKVYLTDLNNFKCLSSDEKKQIVVHISRIIKNINTAE